MEQGNPTRFEEYTTLREEMLSLFLHSRDILYRTIGLIIIAIGGYAIQPDMRKLIPPLLFTLFLFTILTLSAITYFIAMDQAYRVGGYIAVFLESDDPARWLEWHRFNRHGPRGRFRPNVDAAVYVSMAFVILFFFVMFVYNGEVQSYITISIPFICAGIAMRIALLMRKGLRDRRVKYENEWRLIKGSPVRQVQIHRHYETLPPRV
jgi:hypothetical protein